jgi:hypothetical protein
MYRGSSFLLQRTYTVHVGVIDCLKAPEFAPLWACEFGDCQGEPNASTIVLGAVNAVRKAYENFGPATDTLVTKVLLGTFGCLPALDRYFVDGFRQTGNEYSKLNRAFVDRIVAFARANEGPLRDEQARIEKVSGVRYPLMKLVDMYFWQIGFELDNGVA